MKKKITLLLLASMLAITVQAVNYYSSPSGNMASSGTSSTTPWGSLQQIFAANKVFVGGDTIFLMNGNHGIPVVFGTNNGYVVITKLAGHNPILNELNVGIQSNKPPAQKWKIYNLLIESLSTNTPPQITQNLIELGVYSSSITIEKSVIQTTANIASWTRNDWRNMAKNGIMNRGVSNSVISNTISNVGNVIQVIETGSNFYCAKNYTKNFSLDYLHISADNGVYEYNKAFERYRVYTQNETHADFVQGFDTSTPDDTVKNVIIRGNYFMSTADTNRNFRSYNVQGIGFHQGGTYKSWLVENNVIITNTYHGISFDSNKKGGNLKIINNTVINPYKYTPLDAFDTQTTTASIHQTWILTETGYGTNVVANNISEKYTIAAGTSVANNATLAATGYTPHFVNTAPTGNYITYDLHLKSTSPYVNGGSNLYAPNVDRDGTPRPQQGTADIGAYEYMANGAPTIVVNSSTLCAGSTKTLTASGALTYTWSTGAIAASIVVSPTVTTNYTVTGTAANSFTNNTVATISVIASPTISAASATICNGSTATLVASGANTYVWNTSATTSTLAVSPANTTNYTVTGTNAQGCSKTKTLTVSVITIATPTISQVGNLLTSSSASGNQWYLNSVLIPGATSQTYNATQSGNYSVIVTGANNCTKNSNVVAVIVTGIKSTSDVLDINIYPNPVNDAVTIYANVVGTKQYKLIDVLGKVVRVGDFTADSLTLNLENLTSGLYFINLTYLETTKTIKIIKE